MITLLVRQGAEPPAEIQVAGNIARIGRAPGSQVLLTQDYVSKRHLRVLKGIVLVDQNSSNGTFVDGKRIKDPVLYTGGDIRIGDGDVYVSIRLEEEGEPQTSPTLVAGAESEPAQGTGPLDTLRGEHARLAGELERARERIRELEQAPAAPDAAGAGEAAAREEARAAALELERARAELADLRAQLDAAREAKPAVPLSPAAELFLKLQSENSALKRKVAELQSKAAPADQGKAPAAAAKAGGAAEAKGGAPQAKLLAEIVELRAQNAALRAQAQAPRAVPATPALAPAPAGSAVRALLLRLAKDDVDRLPPQLAAPMEEFLVIEQFRLVRNVERIVTRMAGDAFELLDGKTMLPELQGSQGMLNLRQLIARLGETHEDPEARAELLQYCSQLSRWLVASLGAERKAATAFAHKLKSDLSEETLTAAAPIPAFKRFSGLAEAELWKRAGTYLRELTPDMIQDRLEKLARSAALELVGEGGAQREP